MVIGAPTGWAHSGWVDIVMPPLSGSDFITGSMAGRRRCILFPRTPMQIKSGNCESPLLARRSFLAAGLFGAAVVPRIANAQRDWSGMNPVRYPDPDIIAIDKRFSKYKIGNTPIVRLHTGTLWSEGPAWNSVGRYLVWSDIPNDRQLRWLEDDGHVSVFREPSNNSNGNTFDYQGRQLSCEHLTRRVVRYELDGSITIIADSYQGKHLNSPNDAVPHTDGSLWFTDPPYGAQAYEGAPDAPGGPANANGRQNSRVGQPEPEAG